MSGRVLTTRRALLRGAGAAGLALATAACGYQPMYGGGARNGMASRQLAAIRVGIAGDRIGQIMRTEIERQVAAAGRNVPKVYNLSFSADLTSTEVGIRKDATATRANVFYTVDYELTRDGERVLQKTARSIASYNILDDQYAAIVSREDAERRAAEDVARQIVNRLSTYFVEQGEA
ncbi:LPS assembly lipoprotein LptE [Caenispirillum salinarum]|uniref:LPS assembly lipoprotein LptE n=1 Tax=Caenispirillum salinarum TaxID=859058 RepID=UPI00384DBF21